jgi:hypothetical protein
MNERRPISKTVRFEVFKRDLFACQYCGDKAPKVILHIDHVVPVSKGGDNDILNLVTACASCNGGKSNRQLDDASVVEKSRQQIEDLQERRNQIKLLVEWKASLRNIKDEELEIACEAFNALTGWSVNTNGRKGLTAIIRRCGLKHTLSGIDESCEKYIQFGEDGSATKESVETAFGKISYAANTAKKYESDPTGKFLAYISAILRNRFYEYPHATIVNNVRVCVERKGISEGAIRHLACNADSLESFNEALADLYHGAKDLA